MEYSRQEYWSGLPFLSPGDLLNPQIKPESPALQADSSSSEPPRSPQVGVVLHLLSVSIDLFILDLKYLAAQMVKHLPTVWETQVQSLGREDPLEKEMATHSSTLAWKIPWTEEPGSLQSMGSDTTE